MIIKEGIGEYRVYDYMEPIGTIVKIDNTAWKVTKNDGETAISNSGEKSKAVKLLRFMTYGNEGAI